MSQLTQFRIEVIRKGRQLPTINMIKTQRNQNLNPR